MHSRKIIGNQSRNAGIIQPGLQGQPTRSIVFEPARLMAFGIKIPFGCPAILLTHALDVRSLSFGAVQISLMAGERLADVAQRDGALELRLLAHFGGHYTNSFS